MNTTTSRPILFSAPMVRAILDGTKTQTRRIIKQPAGDHVIFTPLSGAPQELFGFSKIPHAIGDQLWVKETWRTDEFYNDAKPIDLLETSPIKWEADDESNSIVAFGWGRIRQSIFMRKWMSRITLQITDVKIQRLQEISEEDAWAEGVATSGVCYGKTILASTSTGRERYAALWDQINGPGAWDKNPYVAAYTFARTKP